MVRGVWVPAFRGDDKICRAPHGADRDGAEDRTLVCREVPIYKMRCKGETG